MARCVLCAAETKATRGDAAIGEGWLFTEFHGPVGNKYGVYCSGHKWAEVQASLVDLASQAARADTRA